MIWKRRLWIGKWTGENGEEHRVCFHATGGLDNARMTLELIVPEPYISAEVYARVDENDKETLIARGFKYECGE